VKRAILAGLIAALATSASLAEQPRGGYLGVLAGSTKLDVEDTGYSTSQFTWGVFGGWQFLRGLGAEIGYISPSQFTESIVGPAYDTTTISTRVHVFTESLIGTLPLNDTWSLHVRMGGVTSLTSTEEKHLSGSLMGNTYSNSDVEWDFLWGVGIGAMVKNSRVRLEYQRVNGLALSGGLISLGIAWYPHPY
jgi:hypothetical protein